ncbi:oligoendopeptidase [Cytobacillus firmus]|uniref:M3 family oligoendopeptidase n=1 Tax=Cytobacillus firmus TaxID=1399 RepID=UPI00077C4FB8|nr:M3 family oligoendopeptidase [Cytobacillus firmus]MBG9544035.1 oligoendopeptidase [Cytobacillus firmus]MBG9559517.1 oligoendopeptidase [Cytobacillus firmus]MBG9574619.1 oligoendopeptidase [Cytobacillus firmus]MEC1892494.1 M3 family oligoendopeptidase [Cytobacillus firmus]MED4448295.1 M3 family oligoendopeptidase [Cytobacillus firmus]
MTAAAYSSVWDLDVFFKDGSDSAEFKQHLQETRKHIDSFSNLIHNWEPSNSAADADEISKIIELFQQTARKVRQAGAFVSCLQAQNTEDKKAKDLRGATTELSAGFQNALTVFDQKLASLDHGAWEQVINDQSLNELSFVLSERREKASEKLSQEEETVINALAVDGYHGWGQMYDVIVGNIKIPCTENGEIKQLSVGQAANKFSSPDRKLRKEVFDNWEKSWNSQSDYLSKTLNHLAGFRLNVYKLRGWNDFLKEPLDLNRMNKETLETMWEVISRNKAPLVKYLERKAKLLGLEKLSWYDLDAPLSASETKLSYQEGAEFILEQFAQFGEEMTSFSKKAFEEKWIEAEDRPGKAPGGFHTYFPEDSQSRIFMTYSGTPSNVSTLAHELGHGFHTYAMRDLHLLNRNYAMNVAETASTFAEMIVSDAAVKKAGSEEEKLALLEDKVQRSVALLMNIHARFLFETRFYEERKQGNVSAERLNDIMAAAQKEAYGDALDEYHPSFWASKLHFFITGVPFYNFPYTFGYLFSLGIYAQALKEGKGYEEKYIALLKDTASMTVEDLAMKHLNADLTKPEFWESAVQLCLDDVEEFLALTGD